MASLVFFGFNKPDGLNETTVNGTVEPLDGTCDDADAVMETKQLRLRWKPNFSAEDENYLYSFFDVRLLNKRYTVKVHDHAKASLGGWSTSVTQRVRSATNSNILMQTNPSRLTTITEIAYGQKRV